MTLNVKRRPGSEPEASPILPLLLPIVPEAPDTRPQGRDAMSLSRCCRCGRPLASPRSLARGYGPRCWLLTVAEQLDVRRDAVGRRLASLAARVASLDLAGLAKVAAAVEDALEALDAAEGASC